VLRETAVWSAFRIALWRRRTRVAVCIRKFEAFGRHAAAAPGAPIGRLRTTASSQMLHWAGSQAMLRAGRFDPLYEIGSAEQIEQDARRHAAAALLTRQTDRAEAPPASPRMPGALRAAPREPVARGVRIGWT